MTRTSTRRDPYKNFKFRLVLGAAVVGLVGYLTKKALVRSGVREVRRNAYWRLFGMDRLSRTSATWEELALAPDQLEVFRRLAEEVRRRMRVTQANARGKSQQDRAAVTALFSGPSGTGKSMAAQVLANGLGLDVYRVDLLSVISKYPGDTEKHLKRIFSSAEESGAILLFNEADALFGKRSEIRDSHDRYANAEVSYLLERIEGYDGLVILTTNRRQNIDSAFMRRLRYIVEFDSPEPAKKPGRRQSKGAGRTATP